MTDTITIECEDCGGDGIVAMIPRLDPQEAVEQECEACAGRGKVQAEACFDCGGPLPHGCDGCCDRGWVWQYSASGRSRKQVPCACKSREPWAMAGAL